MFPRRPCQNCGRSIAIGAANQIRSHFCPHYKTCEHGTCSQCADAMSDESPQTGAAPEDHTIGTSRKASADT
jgi:hypothetical protein